MRETRQKRANGAVVSYLQIAESVWNPESRRSQARIVLNVGRSEDPKVRERMRRLARSILRRCSPDEIVSDSPDWRVDNAWPYGAVYALEALWKRFGFSEVIGELEQSRRYDFSIERALFAMVASRACAPSSKLCCHEHWLAHDVRIEGTRDLALQHLYRAMDFLEAHKEKVEEAVFFQVADLLNLDVDLIFYDTTSLHFEVEEEDVGMGVDDVVFGSVEAGERVYDAPRKRGHSKNGRGDAPQIVVGLAVTRHGFPVRHWVFPGNTVDVTTVEQVKADLRGWRLGRCVFVGDAGMVSGNNLRSLSLGGGKYVVCMPMRRGDEVTNEVLRRPGRYKTVADNLRVKEVTVGDGERRKRYVICHNPQEETRKSRHRAKLLEELEAELQTLTDCSDGEHTKRMCALRASRRYGRYLRLRGRRLQIDRAKVRDETKLDGKFVVHSNDDTLTPEDMALAYKQLMRVEGKRPVDRILRDGARRSSIPVEVRDSAGKWGPGLRRPARMAAEWPTDAGALGVGSCVAVTFWGLPLVRQDFFEPTHGPPTGDLVEHVANICYGVLVEEPRSSANCVQHGGGLRAAIGSSEEIIFPSERDAPQGALAIVVVDRQPSVLEEAT